MKMRKSIMLKIIFIITIVMLTIIPNFVYAENGETSNVTLDGVYITSNEGTYKTGDTISFEVRFSEDIEIPLILRLNIKIGENSKNVDQLEGESKGRTIKYSYTIQENDSGKISFGSLNSGNEISVKNSRGENIKIENNVKDFKESINININESDWTEVKDVNYTIDKSTFDINISEIPGIKNHIYHFFFTVGDEKINIEKDENGQITNSYYSSSDSINGLFDFTNILEKNGDIYLSIVEE